MAVTSMTLTPTAASTITSRIHTVLCRTSKPENVGSVARSLRAMGISRNGLILLSPQFELFSGRTKARSKNIHPRAKKTASGAVGMLQNTKVVERWDDAIGDCSFVVGATSRPLTETIERQDESRRDSALRAGHDQYAYMNVESPIFTPRECANMIFRDEAYHDKNVVIVFGPEHGGLSEGELFKCHAYLTIPTDPEFPSLNLAMAVQIWAYELRMASMYADGV